MWTNKPRGRYCQIGVWSWMAGVLISACGSHTPVTLAPETSDPILTTQTATQTALAEASSVTSDTCITYPNSAYLNLPYQSIPGVNSNLLSLDVYLPEGATCDRPVVVWVHGGAWMRGDKTQGIENKRTLFNQAGYIFVSVNYRLSPDPFQLWNPFRIKYPIHPQDVATAVDFIHDNVDQVGGDPDQIALLGHSAGGGIVAQLGTDESFLQTVGHDLNLLRCVGSLDIDSYDIPLRMATAGLKTRLIYENAFGSNPTVWADASPINHVAPNKGIPPFLLVNRGGAMVTNFVQSLTDAGIETTLIDALTLSHEEVSTRIGQPGDTIMTPPLMNFLAQCFSQ